jgi:hypothetical protein
VKADFQRRELIVNKPMTCLCALEEKTNVIKYERQRAKLGKVPIISRTIPISIDNAESTGLITIEVTIWEMEKPSEMIQTWWSVEESDRRSMGDPFGVVMWPGSIVASRELMKHHYYSSPSLIANSTVLVLGAGTGVEAQAAALLGADKVIATDINQLTLNLLDFASSQKGGTHGAKASLTDIIESRCKCSSWCSSFGIFRLRKLCNSKTFIYCRTMPTFAM